MLLNWIWGFLCGRNMSVSVDGLSSSVRGVSSGVPQGSVLGPVLFLVYINYLTDGLISKHGVFADDYEIYLYYSRNGVHDGMLTFQTDLNRLSAVANSWNLFLSNGKYVIVIFSRRNSVFDTLDGDF